MRKYWIITFLTYLVICLLSYGFVTSLYSYRDDYALLYQFQLGRPFGWPYQGVTIFYYPFYLIFGSSPVGYFSTALVLYILLAVLINYFILKISKNYTIAFVSGLIFSSGFIGAESMFMFGIALASISYLIATLLIILLYKKYLDTRKIRYFLFTFLLFSLAVFILSYRAHTLFLILFLTDLFFSKTKKGLPSSILKSLKRTSVFIILTISFFVLYPKLSGSGFTDNSDFFKEYVKDLSFQNISNFFSVLSNYFIPSSLKEKFFSGITLGLVSLASLIPIVYMVLVGKMDRGKRKLAVFLILAFVSSYLIYHIKEPNIAHWSSNRYLLFGFPFFSMLAALIIENYFLSRKSTVLKIIGALIILGLLYENISNARLLVSSFIVRSIEADKFFKTVKNDHPAIRTPTLFYFDVVNDTSKANIFWDILRVGIYPSEVALAQAYRIPYQDLKVVDSYEEFLEENSKGNYREFISYFYSIDGWLINTSKLLSGRKNSIVNPEIKSDTREITYNSILENSSTKTILKNSLVKVSFTPIPVSGNLYLKLAIKLTDKSKEIKIFPLNEGTVFDVPSTLDWSYFEDEVKMNQLTQYVKDRELFRTVAKVSADSFEYRGSKPENTVDSDPGTFWLPNRPKWLKEGEAWLSIEFPNESSVSEIRFISSNKSRLPISYEYQVMHGGEWETFFKNMDTKIEMDKCHLDRFNSIHGKKFRIKISATSGDFPQLDEIELLPIQSNVGCSTADFILMHPFAKVPGRQMLENIVKNLSDYQYITLYPLSDKYLDRQRSIPVRQKAIIDGKFHNYNVKFSQGGTTLSGFLVEFPNLYLGAEIKDPKIGF